MIKRIIIIAVLLSAVTFNSYADDSERIDQLEKQVQELKLRVSKLESLLSKPDATPSKPDANKDVVPSGNAWKSISSWKKLASGMSHDDVKKILGEPSRERGGDYFETWNYPNSGYVMFRYGKVFRWTEPGQ
jgi:outer membrane protein assembly factor BamE (lipoprotein component of BamABCDE complex)